MQGDDDSNLGHVLRIEKGFTAPHSKAIIDKILLGKIMQRKITSICVLIGFLLLAGCTYNPFIRDNNTTGSPVSTLIGASVAGGGVALLGAPRPWIFGAGLLGGAFGYYVSTLRHDAGAIIRYGGQVYKVGDFIGIYIPTDCLFESNTADFLPKARAILDSTAAVLQRYPDNNILISGNTSGFYCSRWEQWLSERRAQRVAAFLWNAGINNFKDRSLDMRTLNYVGYGDYFPIANKISNTGLRQNSRIQIVSYPSSYDLQIDKRRMAVHNVGTINDDYINDAPDSPPCPNGKC